ncbi:unnamed protein product [Phytophthora fragariaefolia]|uniref:Unnamed protein product n=1 Tax=Phytophthora fragariaefolia TaxID=1490495 RepID=A0A9W6XLX3_9STRA|nr:unnamed protein product [Phytophthora fragariaefolia]
MTDQNVDAMLNAGVIEEDNGAWDFPVVLVRKKDVEVRRHREACNRAGECVRPTGDGKANVKVEDVVFAMTSMECLEHELSCNEVRPVERLVTAVKEFPRLTNPVAVKRFVRLACYYCKFVEAFGSIMTPPTKLLRKDVVWQWAPEQAFACERVMMILTTKPLLNYPNIERPFRLVTDASKVGLGACLVQAVVCGWQPVAYASKVTSTAEVNFSITELEWLAVVCSVKLFRPQLYGRGFTNVTDHAALKWLMTRTNPAVSSSGGDGGSWDRAFDRAERHVKKTEDPEGHVTTPGPFDPGMEPTRPVTRSAKRRDKAEVARMAVKQAATEQLEAIQTAAAAPVAYAPKVTAAPAASTERRGRRTRSTGSGDGTNVPRPAMNDVLAVEEVALSILQVTDDEIIAVQNKSPLGKKLELAGSHRGMKVEQTFSLTIINTISGRRVVLLPALWATIFKECHDAVWAGHLRAPHTYARIAKLYWWSGIQREVRRWVTGCRECGSRNARPKEVIPPL